MPVKVRPNPSIPDHEVLRKIGGGAYGEVWLARGVTGAMRAVKVVWREDFEDERGFEREFEGILKFEPISRDHPGLVNILHVGRSPDASFYYYVMQLGDDVRTGREINPIEYEPRTLRADHHQGPGERWATDECIDVGLRLAEALHHLHESGLAHRDVKPSNVIFVNGKAKLADIGLVAARGQRTFVGTEGFVPPEGPGSTQADVYSLGKVLYEIATGQDRMCFPDLPDEIPSGLERKRWLELNRIICEICEPRISKRKISTAADLAEALRRIQRGKRRRSGGTAVYLTALLLAGFAAWGGWELVKGTEWYQELTVIETPPEQVKATVRVASLPEGADIYDANGTLVGTTNANLPANVGEVVKYTLRMSGYRPEEIEEQVPRSAVNEPLVLHRTLQVFDPPQVDDPWTDHLGHSFLPVGTHHEASVFATREDWERFEKQAKAPQGQVEFISFSQNGQPSEILLATEPAAAAYCAWWRSSGIKAGYLTEDHEVTPLIQADFDNAALSERARRDGLRPFRLMVRRIVYGKITIISDPPGADVYLNGNSVGYANQPMTIPNIKPGEVKLLLVLGGFKPSERVLRLEEGQAIEQRFTLEKNQGVVFGQAWKNSLQMRFEPMGKDLMVSIWETRVSDYEQFVKSRGYPAPRPSGFPQEPEHPVVNVSREDAQAFCKWLTEVERKSQLIMQFQDHEYRLPTDIEWSHMAGLREDERMSPGMRDFESRNQKVFPWGNSWPDAEKVGNFADMSASRVPGMSSARTIPGYDDGFPFTAPVGSFPPVGGLYDLSGNVQEWVEDDYSRVATNGHGVLRGGGWSTYQYDNLYTGFRNAVPPKSQDPAYGFRVVLAKPAEKAEGGP